MVDTPESTSTIEERKDAGTGADGLWRYWEMQEAIAIAPEAIDRKSTRLNSSHANISYAVFCLKKKNIKLQADPVVAYLCPLQYRDAHHALGVTLHIGLATILHSGHGCSTEIAENAGRTRALAG